MSQLLKKYALLTACAVLALCFATRPAHAQSADIKLDPSGQGHHLIFSYWATGEGMDTLIAIHSPLGIMSTGETMNVVQVKIENMMGQDVGMFPICLKPGDSWTAVLSMSGADKSSLTVKDPGGCDDKIAAGAQAGGTRVNPNPITTPEMDAPVTIGASGGLVHAYTMPNETLMDADDTDSTTASENRTDDAHPRPIVGTAHLISSMNGFSSSYNAVALMVTDSDTTTDATAATEEPLAANEPTDDEARKGECGVMDLSPAGDAATDLTADMPMGGCSDMQIETALGMRYRLLGRWTALNDENVATMTTAVVTFPGTTPLMLMAGVDAKDNAVGKSTDAVSLYLFDDMGMDTFISHKAMLNMAVNKCTIGSMMDMMGDDMMGDDMMGDDMMGDDMMEMPEVACNGESLGHTDDYGGGGFQILNNKAGNVEEAVGTYAAVAADGSGNVYSDGAEMDNADGFDDAITPDMSEADDATTDGAGGMLPAIGIVLSFFEGTDGKKYDQAVSLQASDM